MADERYSGYPASFVSAGPVTTDLAQMTSDSIRFGSQTFDYVPPGLTQRSQVGLVSADPVITLVTQDLVTAFGILSPTIGLSCTAATFRRQLRSCGSTFDAGNTHYTYGCQYGGQWIPRSISASQDDEGGVELTTEFHPISDNGLNLPVAPTDNATISGVTPAFVSKFFMGPVYINAAAVTGISRWSLDFGIKVSKKRFGGIIYPTCVTIDEQRPIITITAAKVNVDGVVDQFMRVLAGTIALYGRKHATSTSRVSDVTASHLKLSSTAGAWQVDEDSFSDTEDGMKTFNILPTAAMAASVASAIP